MTHKENRGGLLNNEQLEQDLKVKGKDDQQGGYTGMQDTGDDRIRSMGTKVQQQDGLQDDSNKEANQ